MSWLNYFFSSIMSINILHVGVLMIITMVGNLIECYSLADVQRLKADLLSNSTYDRTMRPIYNQSQAIQV